MPDNHPVRLTSLNRPAMPTAGQRDELAAQESFFAPIDRPGSAGSPAGHATAVASTHCLVCGHTPVDVGVDGRFTTTACDACLAVLIIEFDPPDQPGIRARIERIDDPN